MRTTVIFLSLLVSACGTSGIADHRTFGIDYLRGPKAENNYNGTLMDQSSSSQSALNARATEICTRFGGINEYPKYRSTAPTGWIFYYYRCNGFPPSPAVTKEVSLPQNKEPEKISIGLNLEDARKKCQELGFETGTEAFGKCVLKLSK
jgi:hypothetical protein